MDASRDEAAGEENDVGGVDCRQAQPAHLVLPWCVLMPAVLIARAPQTHPKRPVTRSCERLSRRPGCCRLRCSSRLTYGLLQRGQATGAMAVGASRATVGATVDQATTPMATRGGVGSGCLV